MDGAGSDETCYYSILQIRKNATAADVRAAYRKLALKWHPDRWARDAKAAGEANRRFQRIQEAYSVLSDEGERAMYDAGFFDTFQDDDDDNDNEVAGIFDPFQDDDDDNDNDNEVDITDFVQELRSMMDSIKSEKQASLEELRQMWADIAGSGKVQQQATAKSTKGMGATPAQGVFGGNPLRLVGWEILGLVI